MERGQLGDAPGVGGGELSAVVTLALDHESNERRKGHCCQEHTAEHEEKRGHVSSGLELEVFDLRGDEAF